MDRNKVSVIIPAYNCAGTIRQSIESALEQDVPVEVIVINDSSTDGLDDVMEKYAEDDRIIYMKNEKQSGVAFSRNTGVDRASGDYVAFLDADDWWEPFTLGKRLARMKETGSVLCCTARRIHQADGSATEKIRNVKEKITYQMLLYENSIACSSVILPIRVAQTYKMCYDKSHEDYIAWLRILKEEGDACGINEPWLHYRLSPKGKSRNKLKAARMRYDAYRYLNIGRVQSVFYFICYAWNAVMHYL